MHRPSQEGSSEQNVKEVPKIMPYEFYLGIDALEKDEQSEIAAALVEKRQDKREPEYVLHALNRYLDEDPDDVAQDLLDRISDDPYVGRTVCVTNASDNAGDDFRQRLNARGLSAIVLRVTGGDTSREQGQPLSFGEGGGVQVSEHEIVSTTERIYRSGKLDLSSVKSDEPTALVQGLEDYHIRAGDEGEALGDIGTAPSREATNSALVLAAASAVWLAEQQSFDPTEHLAGNPPPVREAKREMRPDTT